MYSDDWEIFKSQVKPLYNNKYLVSKVNNKKLRSNSTEAKAYEISKSIIDLHGVKINDAFYIFINFIINNYKLNNRFLIVVTGNSLIKKELPIWCEHFKVKDMIISCSLSNKKYGYGINLGSYDISLKRNINSKLK